MSSFNRKRVFSQVTTTTTTTTTTTAITEVASKSSKRVKHTNFHGTQSPFSQIWELKVVGTIRGLEVLYAVVKYDGEDYGVHSSNHPVVFYEDARELPIYVDESAVIHIIDPESRTTPRQTLQVVECEKVPIAAVAMMTLKARIKYFITSVETCPDHVRAYVSKRETILKTFKVADDMFGFFEVQDMIEVFELAHASVMARHGISKLTYQEW